MNRNVLYALAAAGLFGASTPFAKLFAADRCPILLAGVLYLGSGIGVAMQNNRGQTTVKGAAEMQFIINRGLSPIYFLWLHDLTKNRH